MTLIGGLSIVTRQYAGERRVTRICAGWVSALFSAIFKGAFVVDMGSPLQDVVQASNLLPNVKSD